MISSKKLLLDPKKWHDDPYVVEKELDFLSGSFLRLANCHTSLMHQLKSNLYTLHIDVLLILRYDVSIKEAEYGRIEIKKAQQKSR